MPRPERDARFWDRIARRYANSPVSDEAAYERKLAKTIELLTPEDRVLEIGCGTGTTATQLAPHVAHYMATDISANMLNIAREKAAGISNLTFVHTPVAQLPAATAPEDVILAHSVLHLLAQPDQVLSTLAGRLKPGGLLISTTACLADYMPWFRYLVPLGAMLGLLPRVQVFHEQDLLNWHTAAGLEILHSWQPSSKAGIFIIARSQI